MEKKVGLKLTDGKITKLLLAFSIPIFIGNALTSGYGIINTLWIGNLADKNALAILGVCMPIIAIITALSIGFSNASSILISKSFGEDNYEDIKKYTHITWVVFSITVVFTVLIGLLFTKNLLQLVNSPDNILKPAIKFLRIQFIAFIFLYFSTNLYALLRGIGITIQSNIIMVIGVFLNAILDPLLISGLGPFPKLGIIGAGYAYLISLVVSSLAGYLYIKINYSFLLDIFRKTYFQITLLTKYIKIALPLFLQQLFVVLTTVFITIYVNHFGTSAIAAYAVSTKLDTLAAMLTYPLFITMANFAAQNLGNKKLDRIKSAYNKGLIINVMIVSLIWIPTIFVPEKIIRLFTSNIDVIKISTSYLSIVGIGYVLFALMYVSMGTLNGLGKTNVTMVISFISLCLFRIPLSGVIYRTSFGITGIWIIILISMLITTLSCMVYFYFWGNKGKTFFNISR